MNKENVPPEEGQIDTNVNGQEELKASEIEEKKSQLEESKKKALLAISSKKKELLSERKRIMSQIE